MTEGQLTKQDVVGMRKLLEIEHIRKKQLLYSQLLDSHDFEGFAELYTDTASADWGPAGIWQGRAKILERIRIEYADRLPFDGMHITSNMWIELTGDGTASSRCYLFGVDNRPVAAGPIASFAIYESDWEKAADAWQIAHHRIFFLWPHRHAPTSVRFRKMPTGLG